MSTKYILEYRYMDDDGTGWITEDEFASLNDAQYAYTNHIKAFNFIRVRVRKVKCIEESSILGEYAPLADTEDDE